MPELQLLKTLVFPRAFQKLHNCVNSSIFVYLRFFSVFIINGSTVLLELNVNKQVIEENKDIKVYVKKIEAQAKQWFSYKKDVFCYIC